MSGSIDVPRLQRFMEQFWSDSIQLTFERYVGLPCINLNYVPCDRGPSSAPSKVGCDSGPSSAPSKAGKEDVLCYYPNNPDTCMPYAANKTGWQEAMKQAADLAEQWQNCINVKYKLGATIIRKKVGSACAGAHTPMMLIHIPGDSGAGNVLMWGHLDKQTTTGEDGKDLSGNR